MSKDRNDLWKPPEEPGECVRKLMVGGVELTLPPKPKKGAFEKALQEGREAMARKDARDQGYAGVVTASANFRRILNIPRREIDLNDVMDLTGIFRKPGGTMFLRPIQSLALYEAHIANGMFGPIGVGHGKTLITLLMPEAMDSERTVLLVPPQLRDQLNREIVEVYGPHFNLPLKRIVRILAYSELSLAKNSDLLEKLKPDLIIADEAHKLRRATSARTKRFLRYMKENPHCRFVGLSGTITTKSILDYAHLLELALRKNSPLPDDYRDLQDWAGALDVEPTRRIQEGVLRQFCESHENARQGFRRRLVQTMGVVATVESAIGTSLQVENTQPEIVPESIVSALQEIEDSWSYNGEEYADPLSLWRVRRQLSCGFYYRWIWPDGVADEEWLEARAAWKSSARAKIKQSRVGMDSEFLVANAADRWRKTKEDHSKCKGTLKGEDHSKCETIAKTYEEDDFDQGIPIEGQVGEEYIVKNCLVNPSSPSSCNGKPPKWVPTECKLSPKHPEYCTGSGIVKYGPDTKLFESEEWIAWKKVKNRYNPTPPTEVVWISDWLAFDVAKKTEKALKSGHKVIIWYTHKPMGEHLAEITGYAHYGAGMDASTAKENAIICSITTQGTGKNLQHYDYNIIVSMPTNAKDFEQLVGRTHRPGQLEDLVSVYYYDHTQALDSAMTAVVRDAIYIEDSTGQKQKILYADGESIKHKKQSAILRQTLSE